MDNKTLVRTFLDDVFNKRDLSKLSTYCVENFSCHDTMYNPRNLTELRRVYETFHTAFTDMRIVIEAQFTDGDYVCTRITVTGKDTGGFMGKPASGKKFTVTGMQFDRVQNGRLQEEWLQMDYLSMVQQLNLVPRLESSKPAQPYQPHA